MTLAAENSATPDRRLDSWKEIASFFDRDERTVHRWEKELGLPIHRLPGAKGRVYAYTYELEAWLAAPRIAQAVSPPNLNLIAPPAAAAEVPAPVPGRSWNLGRLGMAALLTVSLIALAMFYRPRTQQTRAAATPGAPTNSSGKVVLASLHSHDPQAEELYLKGRYYWNKRTPADLNTALDYFNQAIVHDPNDSQAYTGVADCYNLLREFSLMPESEAYARARVAAKKAVELDDQSSEAHASLGFVSFFGMWDLATGEREFRRAIDLNPSNAVAHHWYANALMMERRFTESLAEIERAQALEPSSTAILSDKANIFLASGRRDEGIALLKQMETTEPSFLSPHRYLRGAYLTGGDYPDFLAEWKIEASLIHDDSDLTIETAAEKGFAAGGAHEMFEDMLQQQKKLYDKGKLPPMSVAETYALLGKKRDALQYLQLAYARHDDQILGVAVSPALSALHNEVAYQGLMARLGLPAQN